ncbi:hypothetical protein GCM10007906_38280 [Vibrio hyugaensis]|uniref:Uncharacterized protein n=1 Tax=Vibrio hyugaensis TaxID=1534743 RepID=A0ABQ5YAY6_9VIBR|nr:hypothetical protein GCM10007906_38280 [Vibrio hyugaensis]
MGNDFQKVMRADSISLSLVMEKYPKATKFILRGWVRILSICTKGLPQKGYVGV